LIQRQPTGITLYVDASWESQQAQQVLTSSGLTFSVIHAGGSQVPGVMVGKQYYAGLRQVESVARLLSVSRSETRG